MEVDSKIRTLCNTIERPSFSRRTMPFPLGIYTETCEHTYMACTASPASARDLVSYSILTTYLNQLAVTGSKVSFPDRLNHWASTDFSQNIQEPECPRERYVLIPSRHWDCFIFVVVVHFFFQSHSKSEQVIFILLSKQDGKNFASFILGLVFIKGSRRLTESGSSKKVAELSQDTSHIWLNYLSWYMVL